MAKNKEVKEVKIDEQTEHFMRVCPHGVPHGYKCGTCNKVISIPEDAKIKPVQPKE